MNAIERVNNRLNGKKVDRIPNLNIIMQFAAKYINVPYGKYCTDYRYLVEGNIKCCEEFGIDMVSSISDPFRETAGFGANVEILADDVPSCKEHLLQEPLDLKRLKPLDPSQSERMHDRVAAIAHYREECGGEYPILGWVEGAFAEANDLRGINNLMLDLFDEPEFVEDLLNICYEQAVLFAKAQIREGATFIGIGDAVASLIGPELYQQYAFPLEKRLIQDIHALGAKAKLHICGNTTALLPYMVQTGADVIDIDHMVDLAKAVEATGYGQFISGNFDPVTVLLQGSAQDVQQAVHRCMEIGRDKIFMSAGCEVPKFTPPENLKAVAQALLTYSC